MKLPNLKSFLKGICTSFSSSNYCCFRLVLKIFWWNDSNLWISDSKLMDCPVKLENHQVKLFKFGHWLFKDDSRVKYLQLKKNIFQMSKLQIDKFHKTYLLWFLCETARCFGSKKIRTLNWKTTETNHLLKLLKKNDLILFNTLYCAI